LSNAYRTVRHAKNQARTYFEQAAARTTVNLIRLQSAG
jgi:hypothetical protein